MIISISGDAGSGKSTIAKMLSEKLGMKRYYVGALRRRMAKKKNMTLEEYNELGETDERTDREVDEWQKNLGEKEDNFIIEGRTSFYFIPHSLKLYLAVDERDGARRIWQHIKNGAKRNEAEHLESFEDVLASVRKRRASDERRYRKYYNLNAHDTSQFDCVIDTTNKTIEQVFDETLACVQSRHGHSIPAPS